MLAAWTVETAAPMAAAAVGLRRPRALRVGAVGRRGPRATRSGSASRSCSTRSSASASARPTTGKSWRRRRAALEEARRRAEAARLEADAASARAEQELQKERTARRTREDEAIAAAGAAQAPGRRAADRSSTRRTPRSRSNRTTRRARRNARARSKTICGACAPTRASCRRGPRARSRGSSQRDERALADAVAAARQLSVSLDALQRRVREGTPGEGRRPSRRRARGARRASRAPTRRTAPQLPPGVVAELARRVSRRCSRRPTSCSSSTATTSRTAPGPTRPPGDQRERLGIAATALCRRLGCEVVLVFDGDGSGHRPVAAAGRRAGAVLRRRRRGRRGRGPRGREPAPPDPGGGRVVGRLGARARPRPGRRGGGRRRPRARHPPRPLAALGRSAALACLGRRPGAYPRRLGDARRRRGVPNRRRRSWPCGRRLEYARAGWAGVVGARRGESSPRFRDPRFVEPFTRALEALDPVGGLVDVRSRCVPVVSATRARVTGVRRSGEAFRPLGPLWNASTSSKPGTARGSARFIASVSPADAEEAGLMSCTSPRFGVADGDDLVAAAGYRVWSDELAHMSVLVAPEARGRGRGRAVAGAATEHALASGLLAQWRAVPLASRAVAATLGYEPRGWQVRSASRRRMPRRHPLSQPGSMLASWQPASH